MSSPLSHLGLVLALMSVLAAPAACGGDEFTSTGGAGAAGSGGGGEGASGGVGASATAAASGGSGGEGASTGTCASSDEICLPAPAGWSGPVVVLEDTSAPLPCGGNWSNEVFTAYQGPIEAPSECSGCECAPPLDGGCEVPEVTVYQSNTCAAVKAVGSSGPGCTALPNLGGSGISAAPANPTPGDCFPNGGDLTEGPISWAAQARLCDGAPAGDACQGGTCYPAPEGDARVCVYRDGEHECPPGYSNQHALHHGALDERTCTACQCGPEEGAECAGMLYGYTASVPCDVANPDTGAQLIPQDDSCQDVAGSVWKHTRWQEGPRMPGACEPTGGEPGGEVTPVDPVTVCCRGS
jgi:hypothetical protein